MCRELIGFPAEGVEDMLFLPVKKFRANPHKISICQEGGPFGAMIVCDG